MVGEQGQDPRVQGIVGLAAVREGLDLGSHDGFGFGKRGGLVPAVCDGFARVAQEWCFCFCCCIWRVVGKKKTAE